MASNKECWHLNSDKTPENWKADQRVIKRIKDALNKDKRIEIVLKTTSFQFNSGNTALNTAIIRM
jgi:hypothetical protein